MPAIEVIASQDESMSHPEPGLRRQVMSWSPDMMLVRHRMKKGWVGARHSHPHEQMVYIISGHLTFEYPGGVFEAKAGDSFLVPGDVGAPGFRAGGFRGAGHLHSLSRRLRAACLASPPGEAVRLAACVDLRDHRELVEIDHGDIVIAGAGYKGSRAVGLHLDSRCATLFDRDALDDVCGCERRSPPGLCRYGWSPARGGRLG